MPDFNKILADLKAKRQENMNIDPSSSSYQEAVNKRNQVLQQRVDIAKNKGQEQFGNNSDIYTARMNNDQNAIASQDADEMNKRYNTGANYLNELNDPYQDPNQRDVNYMYENALSKIGKSLTAGVGDVAQGWGDALQFATSLGYITGDGWDDNPLQILGTILNEDNKLDTDIDFTNDDISLADMLLSSEFWTTQAPKVIPQIADAVLIGKGIGKGVQGASKLGARALLTETAETAGKFTSRSGKSLTGVIDNVYDGAKGAQTTLGRGSSKLSYLYNDKGQLNKTLMEVMNNTGSGVALNMKLGMQNGTEMFNTYSNLKDPNNPNQLLFTKEEAAEIARNTFGNQLMYAPVDVLSYALTFGSNKYVGNALRSSNKEAIKFMSNAFANSQKHILGKGAKVLGIAGFEGLEESFQESFEEFAKLKAFYNKTGSYDNYQGIKPEALKGNKEIGFFDYLKFYASDENKNLRNLSGALGAVMGGFANVKTLFNKQANEAADAINRVELLTEKQEKGTEGYMKQDGAIRAVINEAIMQDRDEHLATFLTNIYNKGVISDEQLEYYNDIYNKTVAEKARVVGLESLNGKVAYMNNHQKEMQAAQELENVIQQAKDNIAFHDENITNESDRNKAIAKETQILQTKVEDLSKIIIAAKNNKSALLAGKTAYDINPDYSTDGTMRLNSKFFNGLSRRAFNEFQKQQKELQEQALAELKLQEELEQEQNIEESKTDIPQEENLELNSINKKYDEELNSVDAQIQELSQQESTPEIEEQIKQLEESKNDINQNRQDEISLLQEQQKIKESKKNDPVDEEVLNVAEKFKNEEELTPEEEQKIVDNEEEFERATEVLSVIESGVDTLLEEDGVLNPEQIKTISDNKDSFLRIAKKKGLENAENALADNISDTSKLNSKEKSFVESVKENKVVQKSIKAVKNAFDKAKKRRSSEFNLDDEYNSLFEDIAKNQNEEVRFKTDENNESDIDEDFNLDEKLKNLKSKLKEILSNKSKITKEYLNDFKKYAKELDLDKDALSKLQELNNKKFVNQAKAKTKEILSSVGNTISNRGNKSYKRVTNPKGDLSYLRMQHYGLVEQIHAQDAINRLYPNSNITLLVAQNISDIIGSKALAAAANGIIYVDEKSWLNNNRDFFHEVSHIHFALSKDTDETKKLVDTLLQNKPLVEEIKKRYKFQIKYSLKDNPAIATEADIINGLHRKIGRAISRSEAQAYLDSLKKDGLINELPIEQQDIIVDEIYAASMEIMFDNNFKNKLFETKTEEDRVNEEYSNKPKEKSFVRKAVEKYTGISWFNRVKKGITDWLSATKENARKKTPNEVIEDMLNNQVMNLDEKKSMELYDLKNKTIETFLKGNPSNWTNPEARYKIESEFDAEYYNQIQEVRNKVQEEQKKFVFGNEPKINRNEQKELDAEMDQVDDLISNEVNEDDMFNVDRIKYLDKTSGLVKQFSELYNKGLRRNYFKTKKSNEKWNIPTFDGDQLLVDLYSLAEDNNSAEDFILEIENSESDILKSFNDFLTNVKGDKYSYLTSFWMLGKDIGTIDSVQAYVNSNGKFEIQSSTNMRENFEYDKIFDKVQKSYNALAIANGVTKKNKFKLTQSQIQAYVGQYDRMNNSVQNIRNGDFTNEDIFNVGKFFGATDEMFNENKLFVDGRKVALDKAIVGLANRLGNNTTALTQDPNNPNANQIVMPGLIKFIRAAVVSNRKFTSDFTVQNAEGNQTPSRVVKGHINRKIDMMNKDGRELTKRQFIDKYSRVKGKGVYTANSVLGFMYDNIQNGKDISLSQFNGVKNDKDNFYSTFDGSNSNDNSLMEFFTFAETVNKGSYIMETGRYADSPISYMLEVPVLKLPEFGQFKDGKFSFNSKTTPEFIHAVNSYNNFYQDKKITASEAKSLLENAVANEIDFLNNNSQALSGLLNLKPYLDDKGKLNSQGQRLAASYVVNNWMNKLNFNQIFLPDIKGIDYTKRAKALKAPGYSFGKNVKVENLYFVDDKYGPNNDNDYDDSGMYILEEDAQRIQSAFGNILEVGRGYKLLNAGMEMDNPNFKGTFFYDKGYTTILTKEYVQDNPRLEGLYNTMLKRRNSLGDVANMPLTGNDLSSLIIATPLSANKVKGSNLPSKINDLTLDYYTEQYRANSELDTKSEVDNLFDSMYRPNGELIGLSGENLSLQQKMDKVRYDVNTPIQMIKSVLSEGSVVGDLSELESIQKDLADLEQDNLNKFVDRVLNGDNESVLKFFRDELVSQDKIDKLQGYLLKDGASINVPAIRSLAINTFLNHIKKNGNKLKTPGTIAQQKPSNKYVKNIKLENGEVVYVSTNGNLGLNFYEKNPDGSHKPGEAVVPNYLKGKVRPRQYRLFSVAGLKTEYYAPNQNAVTDEVLKYANGLLKKAKELKAVNQNMSVEEFIDNHQITDISSGNVIGLYIPGDNFMATRVPSHGVQSTGFFEAVGFDSTGASNVQLPTQFSQNITGGDYDGDQVFIQYKSDSTTKWNGIFDKIKNRWLSKEMANEVLKEIDFKQDVENAVPIIEENLGRKVDKTYLMGTPEFSRQAFNDTTVSKNNVGAVANYHSYVGLLSTYKIPFDFEINIDGKSVSSFDEKHSSDRSINSAKLMNIVLDNAKEQYADKLGLNQETVGDFVILTQLGFGLEQIGTIMNSDAYVDYVNKKKGTRNSFSPNESLEAIDSDAPINISTKDFKSNPQTNEVLSLIRELSRIKSDLSDISSIMSGHTRIESDPHLLSEQLQGIDDLLNNKKGNQAIIVNEDLKNNPLLQNYISTAKTALEVQENYDPTTRTDWRNVYRNITYSTTKNLSKNQKKKIKRDLDLVAVSRLLGWNNIPEDYKVKLTQEGSNLNLYERVGSIVEKMKNTAVSGDNVYNMVSEYDTSLLFSKGLSINTDGNSKYISLRSSFFSDTMSDLERDEMRNEFNDLDEDLKRDLLIYDMMNNGWQGPKSLFHLAPDNFIKEVSKFADQDMRIKDFDKLSKSVQNQMEFAVAELNQSIYPNFAYNPLFGGKGLLMKDLFKNGNQVQFNNLLINDNRSQDGINIMNKIARGEPVTMFHNESSTGKKYYIKFDGLTDNEMQRIKNIKVSGPNSLRLALNQMMPTFLKERRLRVKEVRNPKNSNIGNQKLTSIADTSTNKKTTSFTNADDSVNAMEEFIKNLEITEDNKRYKVDDYWNYDETLTRGQFDHAMEFESFYKENDKENAYKEYLMLKSDADKEYSKVNSRTVKDMSSDELVSLFNKYGDKNKFAYSKVMTPITMELAQRISNEQTEKYTQVQEDGNDISPVKKYLMANNIPSNHPMVQGLVRNLENQFKLFQQQKSNYQGKLNDATNNLYKEKLGYLVTDGNLKDKLKALWDYLFSNKEELYNKLYGNLITYDLVQQTAPDGKPYTMKVLKYKTKEVIENDLKSGKISQAEYDFYKTTSDITEDLGKFAELKNGKRSDYIPHTAPGQMEAFSRRGLMGLLVTSKTMDHRIKDVKMKFKHPVSGEIKTMSFGDIDFLYDLANSENSITRKPIEYYNLKKQAIKLLKKGINEDGTPIQFSDIDMGTAIGDTFVNRFTNSASRSSNNFTSLDLNKSFSDYIHSSLFTNGNSEFKGMKNMLPIVDGVLAQLDSKGMKNMSAYVSKVWKDNFLRGTKQKSIKTPAFMEAAGISSDSVVDYITKGSLIYWLGYKGLAAGYGLYAIGNVLAGKFANISNQGGKTWLKGEKRFWLGRDGKFNLRDPFKGVREATAIMNKGGYMNINLFDDVATTKKNSFEDMFMSMALMPMAYSEKWIQGVHFLGMLSDEEWDIVSKGGNLPVERTNEIENTVKLSHGKGFQPTDQRMIQMYSWGRMMMQFSRHIPTIAYNAFGAKDKDIYGKEYIGTYRQVYDTIQKVVTGAWTPEKFKKYYDSLSDYEKGRLRSGLMGFGILAGAGALAVSGIDNKYANDLASDTNIFFDTERLGYKLMNPPALGMLDKLMK